MTEEMILNTCRVCSEYLDEGTSRYNDFIAFNTDPQFKNIKSPICLNCAADKPDELHNAYLSEYGLAEYVKAPIMVSGESKKTI